MDTSHDAPAMDCAYKLEEYAGIARRKRSEGKATWPGRKQVFRRYGSDGRMAGDEIAVEGEAVAGEPLITCVMRGGKRIDTSDPLPAARARCREQLDRLPDALRGLQPAPVHPVQVSPGLRALANEVDRRMAAQA